MDTEKTKVIFRKFKDGDIIAMFPEEPGTNSPYTCSSYMHIGQHGSCDPDIVRDTDPASESEYSDLARELKSIGYNLQTVKKFTQKHLEIRREKLKR